MPRDENSVPTRRLKISTTPQIYRDLELLKDSGYFGKTAAEVAEAFVRERVRQHVLEGWTTKGAGGKR